MKNTFAFRLCLIIFFLGCVAALLPLTFPESQTEITVSGSDAPTNVVMTSNNRYMKLTLEGANFTANLTILRLAANGSFIPVHEFVYDVPSVISIVPGVYVIQIHVGYSAEPIRVSIRQFDTPLRYFYIGVPVALVGLVLVILILVRQKRV